MQEIETGSYYRAGEKRNEFEQEKSGRTQEPSQADQVGTFYVLLDTLDRVYTDRDGEYAWNLLKK
jgi:hypothetical protein